YATLSHCWGGTQHLQSTIGTLDQRKKSIPLSSMNQTFRDAVNITRSLGLQYIWIDSLCIIQDSHSDWLQESGKMCPVYSNAVVNIAATSSSNGDESFLHSRPRAIALPNIGTLSTRAWCYQEEILSPRTISFCHAQVGFECRKLRCRENDPSSSDVPSSFDKNERFRFSSLLAPSSSTERDDVIKLWHSMVGSYSKRKLSFTKDKLPAISGLAMQIGFFLKDHYLAGLWRSDLPYELCWSAENVDSSFKATPYTAPTWSWASQTGGV
ncbi:HET-domain-containing protein, partial [Stipitochalara longipes BDJ]